jgi:excisionase family DNA binding protein
MKNLKSYITIGEAARFLGVTEMTLRRWDEAGKLKAFRNPVNNYRLYRRSDLKALLTEITRKNRIRK